jgi:phosphohistidine phosphatase
MPTLYLLRHAKSDWSDLTLPDERRGLSQRGRRDARLLAALLRRDHIEPDLILCSTAQRTRETLELLLAELGHSEVHLEPELYGASGATLLDRLQRLPEQVSSAMLIGHNPGLQELAVWLTAPGKRRQIARGEVPDCGARNHHHPEELLDAAPQGSRAPHRLHDT